MEGKGVALWNVAGLENKDRVLDRFKGLGRVDFDGDIARWKKVGKGEE